MNTPVSFEQERDVLEINKTLLKELHLLQQRLELAEKNNATLESVLDFMTEHGATYQVMYVDNLNSWTVPIKLTLSRAKNLDDKSIHKLKFEVEL